MTFKLAAILDLKVKTRSNCKTDIKKMAAILDFCQLRLMHTLLRATPLQFRSLTFKEDKNTKKRTFALHGHGSAPDDPTIQLI